MENKLIGFLVVLGIGIIVGLFFLFPMYGRYQAIKDQTNKNQVRISSEQNQIQVNELQIQQTEQLVKVEQQKADIRVVDAQGISKAQDIINKTLTDQYLQHEAIQAQTSMANSPNHTEVYIPVGTNGIPLVRTVNP